MTEAMREIYDKSLEQKSAGKGQTLKDARCSYLREAVRDPEGPLCQLAFWSKEDATDAIIKASSELETSLDEMLGKIQNAFDRMKDRKENDTPEGIKFRTELHQLVDESRRILEGVGNRSLELCKAFK